MLKKIASIAVLGLLLAIVCGLIWGLVAFVSRDPEALFGIISIALLCILSAGLECIGRTV